MKKKTFIFGLVLASFLLITHSLYAQRIYRNDPVIENDYLDLNLTQEQMEKIDRLELDLEKELSPLISQLRSNYMELDELEAQRNLDLAKINKIWDVIYKLEEDIRSIEISHEKKIRNLLSEEQKAIFNSYYAYGPNPQTRGNFGRGYYGRGFRRLGRGNYGYGRYNYGGGMRRNYLGRGAGRLGRGNYRYYSPIRYGRGPCGAGLGKWYRMGYGRGFWNWR
jgi:hypothetical protein